MRNHPQFIWQRTAFLLVLLLSILSFVFTRPGAAADGSQPVNPSVPTPELMAYAEAGDTMVEEPFPATPTLTDTILAVVSDLNQMPQPLTPPDAAVLPQVPAEPEISTQHHLPHHVYVPAIVRPRSASGQPGMVRADVAVTLRPSPSVRVMRGGLLAYEIRLTNYGEGSASSIKVRVPYQRQQMTLSTTSFTAGSGDWVSAIENEAVIVTFGPLAAGAHRAGTLYFRSTSTVAYESVISTRATFAWSDSRLGGSGQTNWAPVIVGAGDVHSAYLWLSVSPASGKAGTVHRFFSDRFIPGEGIIVWLNTPSGVKPLEVRTIADSYGRVSLDLSSIGLAPGNYGLVLYGARSNLTGVAGFTVLP